MSKFQDIAQQADNWIRSGDIKRALELLTPFEIKNIPREHRAQWANLFMRAGQPDQSLRLLNRIVRAKGAKKIEATPEEIKEYSAALISIGVAKEAITLLKTLNTNEVPGTLLFMALAHFTQWQYHEAIPYLENYIQMDSLSDYQKTVGQVNLLSAYIVENKIEMAHQLCQKLIEKMKDQNTYKLLFSNVQELQVQLRIKSRHLNQAQKSIEEAYQYIEDKQSLSSLFLEKWRALSWALNPQSQNKGLNELQLVAKKAERMQHWETLRECHFFLSRIFQDDYAFFKVYFGTPYEDYKKRMLNEFPNTPTIPKHFVLHKNQNLHQFPHVLDLQSGLLFGTEKKLNTNALPFQLLKLLSTDFYSPFRVAKIFTHLFPQDHFDPFSSPHRVHSLIHRLREELKEQQIPLVIESIHNHYRIQLENGVSLKVDLEIRVHETCQERQWQKLQQLLEQPSYGSMDRNQIAQELGVSYRTVSRLLKWAKENNKITSTSNLETHHLSYKLSG